VFPGVYAVITGCCAAEAASRNGFFREPEFISRLVVKFAVRYFKTLDWSLAGRAQDCSAWDIAYGHAARAGIPPIQHAALGISAHINFDLALGIRDVIQELMPGRDPERLAAFKHDHDAVNILLGRSLPEALALLASDYDCQLSETLSGRLRGPLTVHSVAVLRTWRALVWRNAMLLLEADTPVRRAAVMRQMEASSRAIQFSLSRPAVLDLPVSLAGRMVTLSRHGQRDLAGRAAGLAALVGLGRLL
jgi:hypothetical protein